MADYVTLPFQVDDGVYYYADALHLTQEQIDELGPSGIQAMQQQRFADWLAFIDAPPQPDPPPPEPIPDVPTEEPI